MSPFFKELEMSFSRGSGLFEELINILNEVEVDSDQRKQIYEYMIDVFEDYDCDTLYELMGKDKVFDSIMNERKEDDLEDYED